MIDGKAVAAAVRERVRGRGRGARGDARPAAGARHGAGRRRSRRRRSTCGASTRPARRSGSARSTTSRMPRSRRSDLLELVAELNDERRGRRDPRPAPAPGRPRRGHRDRRARSPAKDVDGLTPTSAGLLARGEPGLVPATPQGVMELIASAGVDPEGKEAVIVGRSNLVGRPLFSLLLGANATVTSATAARGTSARSAGAARSWSPPRVGRSWSPPRWSVRAPR